MIISALSMVTEARLLQGRDSEAAMQTFDTTDHSQRLLHKLGFDDSKLEHYRRLSAPFVIDRRPPGGPDPQHH
ncbi:hypothetical protein L484_002305 [Morus notabilis]|uniref:Uncharacterized protein n=1 Tax=Morus notabilis TaxID=981085 RepID=W9REE3_9ROSA|nr:hypothetical protein L484_002305 [Morus notabilis]